MLERQYLGALHRSTATWHLIPRLEELKLLTQTRKKKLRREVSKREHRERDQSEMATSVVSSLSLKPCGFTKPTSVRGLPSLSRPSTPFRVMASGIKKIKTDTPYGTGGGMNLIGGVDSSGRKGKGKGVYQYVDKYGANVDGYSPIYNEDEWAPTGDVYAGGKTGLLIWAITLAGILAGGALLVYNTSALAS